MTKPPKLHTFFPTGGTQNDSRDIGLLPRSGFGFASCMVDAREHALFPAERELIQEASEKRRREFSTGRHCARLALENLGVPPAAILRDENGAPRWPSGVVGSISHTHGLTIALVGHQHAAKGIGVDVEYIGRPFPADVFERVSTAAEKSQIRNYPPSAAEPLRYAVFSAKESVIKCLYGAFGQLYRFEDIDIRVDVGDNSFTVRLHQNRIGTSIQGRFSFTSEYAVTVVWQPSTNSNSPG